MINVKRVRKFLIFAPSFNSNLVVLPLWHLAHSHVSSILIEKFSACFCFSKNRNSCIDSKKTLENITC